MHPYLTGSTPIAMAHRGAHGDGAGENSLEAFARAVQLGYGYLETDVHRTADGELIAMHDPTLERTTDGQGEIAQRAWGEIARLRVAGGGRVPRLLELLDRWPDVRWNIDCKAPDAADDLLRVVHRAGALHRVCIGSFDHGVVTRLRGRAGDQLCTAATRNEVRRLVAAARAPRALRRALTVGIAADAVQVPAEHDGTRIVTERFVEVCRELGLQVHVWTVDTEAQMHGLLDLGVDGLISDASQLLLDVLTRRAEGPAGVTGGTDARIGTQAAAGTAQS